MSELAHEGPTTAVDFIVNGMAASTVIPTSVRGRIYRAMGMDIHRTVRIKPKTAITTNRLVIGKGSTINWGCTIDNTAPVRIGTRCGVGPGVMLITSGHDRSDERCRAGIETSEPIVIGDGSWIGSGVTILQGVTIGPGCVIAAGAVVVRDCAPNGLYAGIPARLIADA